MMDTMNRLPPQTGATRMPARLPPPPAWAWLVRLFALTLIIWLGWAQAAQAAGGSYATAGTGTYAQSLWWLDFSSFTNSTTGQAISFTLPNGAGTLSTTVKRTGTTTMAAVAAPAWSGGGAIGQGAYNGITGSPILYWLNQTGTGTVTLSSMVMKDAAGNARTFAFYAADGENTDPPESIVYTTSATWQLIDTVNYYANFNGAVPSLAGTGTGSVTETPPASGDNNYNASIVLGTQNPTQVSAAFSGNEAALFAVSLPTITLNLSIAGRVNAADQFTANIGYTSPAAITKTASTSGTGTTAGTGATSVIGTNSITLNAVMASGSVSLLSAYTGSLSCANSGPGAASFGGVNTVLPGGAGTSFTLTPQTGDNIACTLTLTKVTETIAGTVYSDANHNANLDSGESGTGIAGLYVKLAASSGGVCQNPATATAAVTAGTGAYSLPGNLPGAYCLTLTNNNVLSNTTPYLPPGWIGTEAPSGVRQLTLGTSPPLPQNLGLYNGSQLTAQVFGDTGIGGGTANDGVQNGSEGGLGNITVTANAGGSAIASATTNASGSAVLWLPASTSGSVTLAPTAPSGDLATGGSPGNTGGSYARPTVSFTYAVGKTYTGVTFGLIPPNALAPDGAQTAQPGTTVFYPHTFNAGSAGQVSFSTSAVPGPALAGWSEVLYRDTNCNGQFISTDPQITAPVAATAGQQICIFVKEFIPAGAPLNAQNKVTLSASFTYSGSAAPANSVLTRTDTTTVGTPGDLQLTKQVQNLTLGSAYGTTNNAVPGDTLQYQLSITNLGSRPLSTVLVSDATPAFTTFVSAACPAPASLPAGLTACSVNTQPAVGGQGSLQWTLTGTLAPGSQTALTFQVQVAQ